MASTQRGKLSSVPGVDPIEQQLRAYYEAEAAAALRPAHGARREAICQAFATRLVDEGCRSVLDLGAGPASDHAPFVAAAIAYTGVDLAIGNAALAADLGQTVVPASLFHLPFASASFAAGWSMSTLQHVPDDRIDAALVEFVRVLEPGAPVTVGLWGGRDETVESTWSTSGLALRRHFTLRAHDRIRAILHRHLDVETDETFRVEPSDWEYFVATARVPA